MLEQLHCSIQAHLPPVYFLHYQVNLNLLPKFRSSVGHLSLEVIHGIRHVTNGAKCYTLLVMSNPRTF
jgi:hypothetical protein